MSSEKNHFQNCTTVSKLQLASVISDTFDKSSHEILDKILKNPEDTSFGIASLIHGSLKDKFPKLELVIDSFITPEQAGKLKAIKKHFEDLKSWKTELEELFLTFTSPYQQKLNLILTVPSFKTNLQASISYLKRCEHESFSLGETLMSIG